MSQTITLSATTRTVTGKPVKLLRAKGVLSAVMYGFGTDARNLEIDAKQFAKVFATAGESTLVDVVVDGGAAIKALIQDIQQDPLTQAAVAHPQRGDAEALHGDQADDRPGQDDVRPGRLQAGDPPSADQREAGQFPLCRVDLGAFYCNEPVGLKHTLQVHGFPGSGFPP